ncbi:MAG: hypothetical protein ABIQ31_16020 [Ferruginibacter sp.]
MKTTTISSRLFILAIAFFSFSSTSYCQDQSITNPDPNQLAFTNAANVFTLTGTLIDPNSKYRIDEHALLYPYWLKGVVNFSNGKQLRNIDLAFNMISNELYFKNNNRPNLFADTVRSFFIIDTLNGASDVTTFSNGYPDLGLLTDKSYYQVITLGPVAHLLKYVSKKKRESYQYGSASKIVYDVTEKLFVYNVKNKSLQPIKNTTASISRALPMYANVLQQSIGNKNEKHLTEEEIATAIRQVNDSKL